MFSKYYKYITAFTLLMFVSVFCSITCVVNANILANDSSDEPTKITTTTTTATATLPQTSAPDTGKDPEHEDPVVIIPNNITVCVDAGHGWADVGTASLVTDADGNPLYFEKDINLQISKRLRDELVKLGYTVIMIRESDDTISPAGIASDNICNVDRRVEWVNKQSDIELMISIHCDSYSESTGVNGTRIYYNYNRHSNMAILAPALQEALIDRNAYTSTPIIYDNSKNFASLRYCNKNSILVECGFITGDRDVQKLPDDDYQKQFAKALAEGIDKYFDTIKSGK